MSTLRPWIRRLLPRAAIALAFVCASSAAEAPWDVRVALVIGNSRYTNTPPLYNALNDAKAVAGALRSLGFRVEMVEDGSKRQMTAALENIQRLLRKRQGLAMLYYAGHGIQVNWRNYMLPVEIALTSPAELPGQALDVADVIDVFKAAETRMNIVVLDACRDNPFGTAGSGKGLAPMDAPSGTLLAYATQPGNVAADGDALLGNGPYAQFLTLELRRPFARVEDVFKRVRFQVRKTTRGQQIPWESTSLEEDFVFNDGSAQPVDSAELERAGPRSQRTPAAADGAGHPRARAGAATGIGAGPRTRRAGAGLPPRRIAAGRRRRPRLGARARRGGEQPRGT